MKATLQKAFGYQGDAMNLPVRDLTTALPFYETVLGFPVRCGERRPTNRAALARDQIEIGLAENGGDSSQDGCVFHVTGLDALCAEFKWNGLQKEISECRIEQRDTSSGGIHVVAPDGL